MNVITTVSPIVYLAAEHKANTNKISRYIPEELMRESAEILKDWLIEYGDNAVYFLGQMSTLDADTLGAEYADLVTAKNTWELACTNAGYGNKFANDNFSAVIAYAITGSPNQIAI